MDGIRFMHTGVVTNFMGFNAVGVIIVAMIVTFAGRCQKDAGVGTVIALMLPCTVVLCVVWAAFLAAWQLLGLPWGFWPQGWSRQPGSISRMPTGISCDR